MSKEFNIIDTAAIESIEPAVQVEPVTLDDLSLALIGGGNACVAL